MLPHTPNHIRPALLPHQRLASMAGQHAANPRGKGIPVARLGHVNVVVVRQLVRDLPYGHPPGSRPQHPHDCPRALAMPEQARLRAPQVRLDLVWHAGRIEHADSGVNLVPVSPQIGQALRGLAQVAVYLGALLHQRGNHKWVCHSAARCGNTAARVEAILWWRLLHNTALTHTLQRIRDMGGQRMPSGEAWLIGERRANGEHKYYPSNLPIGTPLKTLAGTIKARWICEQAHQQLKEELGLDHFEGRSWTGLHRYALMTMIAYAFLQSRRLNKAKGGKKNPGGAAATEPADGAKSHPQLSRPSLAGPMSALLQAATPL